MREHVWNGLEFRFQHRENAFLILVAEPFWESMNHWFGSNRNIPKQLSRLWFQSCFTLHCLETIPSWTIFQLGGATTWFFSTNNPQLYANMLGIHLRLSIYFILAELNMKLVIFVGKHEPPILKPTCDSNSDSSKCFGPKKSPE